MELRRLCGTLCRFVSRRLCELKSALAQAVEMGEQMFVWISKGVVGSALIGDLSRDSFSSPCSTFLRNCCCCFQLGLEC